MATPSKTTQRACGVSFEVGPKPAKLTLVTCAASVSLGSLPAFAALFLKARSQLQTLGQKPAKTAKVLPWVFVQSKRLISRGPGQGGTNDRFRES
jgi:hypothetical protein